MTRNKVIELLKVKNIDPTPARIEVLYYLFRKNDRLAALVEISGIDINQFSRATIYRTLLTLCKAGLIYRVLDKRNSPYYAVVKRQTPYSNQALLKNADCYHFQCLSCNTLVCLPLSARDILLPAGFVKKEANLLLTGYCSKCSAAIKKQVIKKTANSGG